MKLWLVLAIVVIVLILIPIGGAMARPRISEGEPVKLSELESLGDLITRANGKQVHLIYVHGMRAEGPGDSDDLRDRLIKSFGQVGEITESTVPLNLSPWPEHAKVGEIPIWPDVKIWQASQPFVIRRVLKTNNDATITIDEVNWWPLLFAMKCRVLITEEAKLAGLDRRHLDLCRRWITEEAYREALSTRPGLKAATKANRYLKHEIMDWGLSDAVITLGPMRNYVRAAIEGAFEIAAGDTTASEFVVISESLGSFAVLDAYERGEPAVRSVLDRTYKLYFLANQFALLELARISNIPETVSRAAPGVKDLSADPATVQATISPLSALADWATADRRQDVLPPISSIKQIIAFSDPNDILTFRVPQIGGACIANVYVRIARPVLGLFANPVTAHSGHWKGSRVWDAMLRRSGGGKVGACPPAGGKD